MYSISDIKTYFESYAAHSNISKVMFGSLDDFIDSLPTTKAAQYPLMYVPYYTRTLGENQADLHYETLSMMMTLYEPLGKNKGKAERHRILDKLEPIIKECIGRLIYDYEAELFPIKQSIDFKGNGPNVSEPIAPNNLIGWAYEFEVMVVSDIQHNPAVWQV
jgi:hypothetical protein